MPPCENPFYVNRILRLLNGIDLICPPFSLLYTIHTKSAFVALTQSNLSVRYVLSNLIYAQYATFFHLCVSAWPFFSSPPHKNAPDYEGLL